MTDDSPGPRAVAAGAFTFVHAADLHLDTPFEGIASASPELAATLVDASLEAFDGLVDLCIARRAAFLLLAGDLYDGADRGLRAQIRLLRGCERLQDHGISVLIVHGNHDPLGEGWSAIGDAGWPPNVTIFASGRVGSVPIVRDGATLATVHGISYENKETRENLALRFADLDPGGRDAGLQVALLHCNVGGVGEHADYSPCTLGDLRTVSGRAGIGYWALGHVHKHQVLADRSDAAAWVVYPGNLQGRSQKPSETGPKGAVVASVEGGAVVRLEHVALDRVRFVRLQLDLAELDEAADLGTLEAALCERAREMQDEAAGRDLVVRASLVGRSHLHAELLRPNVRADLLASLRDQVRATRPVLWWDALRDESRTPRDRAALARRGDFAAELLVRADELAGDLETLAAFSEVTLGELPARSRGVDLIALAGDDPAARLREAEELALDLLEAGDLS